MPAIVTEETPLSVHPAASAAILRAKARGEQALSDWVTLAESRLLALGGEYDPAQQCWRVPACHLEAARRISLKCLPFPNREDC